jgi:hypothetical protein
MSSVAGRQGGGREIMKEKEHNSKLNKQTFEKCQVPGARPEKGHLIPEVKIVNEITCDHV